ncbi:hypothetical protein E2C01_059029 [Portunus trituberculatus]|uniref:Uncharacterized protein n=1 Tax=Portunus trituberculatus TaxID=210409 RepID=A0A5B7H6B2_PORTR|nr:hypothetical protein [Portunus trituberculatus]
MMSQPQKFNGTANDFIDWFKGKKFEKVVLPGNKTWIPKQPSSEEYFLPPVAESVRQEQGKAYALHYQEEFLRDVEVSQVMCSRNNLGNWIRKICGHEYSHDLY